MLDMYDAVADPGFPDFQRCIWTPEANTFQNICMSKPDSKLYFYLLEDESEKGKLGQDTGGLSAATAAATATTTAATTALGSERTRLRRGLFFVSVISVNYLKHFVFFQQI